MNPYLSLLVCCALLVTACGGSPTASLSINGSPVATISAPNISFGDQVVDTTSAWQTITLTNTGSAALSIGGVAVETPFIKSSTCGSSLVAGATCMIKVAFAPTGEGDFTGTVAITDNASGSPQTVSLSGTGILAPPPCIPFGSACYGPGGRGQCCPAPFPHHSYCSNATGWGTCVED